MCYPDRRSQLDHHLRDCTPTLEPPGSEGCIYSKRTIPELFPGEAPLDEQELIAEARNGRVAAYEELVRRYEELAFRTAYLVLRDPGDAEDAAQEAFVKAYYALGRFKPGSPFRPWLVRIITNGARNSRKAAQRCGALAQRYAQDRGDRATPRSPESAALGNESRRLLLEALAQLSDRDQAVLHQRYFLELSEAEMAEALGCRQGTVKSRLSRALRRLKEIVHQHYPELVAAVEEVEEG
jgi:RNA polymerase sigma factor (sigma-70 family)